MCILIEHRVQFNSLPLHWILHHLQYRRKPISRSFFQIRFFVSHLSSLIYEAITCGQEALIVGFTDTSFSTASKKDFVLQERKPKNNRKLISKHHRLRQCCDEQHQWRREKQKNFLENFSRLVSNLCINFVLENSLVFKIHLKMFWPKFYHHLEDWFENYTSHLDVLTENIFPSFKATFYEIFFLRCPFKTSQKAFNQYRGSIKRQESELNRFLCIDNYNRTFLLSEIVLAVLCWLMIGPWSAYIPFNLFFASFSRCCCCCCCLVHSSHY